jgi:hypothetical protein
LVTNKHKNKSIRRLLCAVIEKIDIAEESRPLCSVPPSSRRTTLTKVLPWASAAGVKVKAPLVGIGRRVDASAFDSLRWPRLFQSEESFSQLLFSATLTSLDSVPDATTFNP